MPSKRRASISRRSTRRPSPRRLSDAKRLMRRFEAENCARIFRSGDDVTEQFNDFGRLLDQRGVARGELAFLEIDIVFEADPWMTAKQNGLRDHGKLTQRYTKREPRRRRRQEASYIGHRRGGSRLRPADPQADLEHARRLYVAVLNHSLGQEEMTGFEHFQLRQHIRIADRNCHGLKVSGRVDENVRAHIHAAHIEAADIGLERDDVLNALGRRLHGRAGAWFQWVIIPRQEPRPWPGGKIDQNVAAAFSDALDNLFVEGSVHTRPSGLRVAHMAMNNGRARFRGIY